MAAETIKSRKRRRVARIAVKVAVVILLVYFFLGGKERSPFFYFLEWVGIIHVDRRPGPDSKAKDDLVQAAMWQEWHFNDYKKYAESVGALRLYSPFDPEEGVIVYVISADQNHYEMVAFHNEGNKAYSIKGPIPEDLYRERIARKKVQKMAREKALSFGETAMMEEMDPSKTSDFEKLCETLKDEDANVRAEAASALGELYDEHGVEPLMEALKDEDARVRMKAAYALGVLQDERAVEPLMEALKDEDAKVRVTVVWHLARLGGDFRRDEEIAGPLIEMLRDVDADVRSQAAYVLGGVRDERAVEPLIEALKDPDVGVAGPAATSLGRLKDERAVEPLIEALKDGHIDRAAARALERITGKSMDQWLNRSEQHTDVNHQGEKQWPRLKKKQ
jgi:hypothetical protein